MKKIFTAVLGAALFALTPVYSFASDADPSGSAPSFWQKLGNNIWYILLVIAFGAGLIIINRWQAKIRTRDRKFKEEYDAWKSEHPEEADILENGGVPESSDPQNAEAPAEADDQTDTDDQTDSGDQSVSDDQSGSDDPEK